MTKDTCDKCAHCTHQAEGYYFCELDGDYINESFALDETIGCDGFVSNMDDDDRQEP